MRGSRSIRTRRPLRSLTIATVAGLAAFAPAASAQTLPYESTYTCDLPGVGPTPVTLDVAADVTSVVTVGTETGGGAVQLAVSIPATGPGDPAYLAGANLSGSLSAAATAEAQPNRVDAFTLEPTIEPWTGDRPGQELGARTILAQATLPRFTYTTTGPGRLTVGAFSLHLNAWTGIGSTRPVPVPTGWPDTDGNPTTIDVACTPAPADQDLTVGTFAVVTSEWYLPTVSDVTATSATVCLYPADLPVPEDPETRVYVYERGIELATFTTRCGTVSGLEPDTPHTFTAKGPKDPINASQITFGDVQFRTLAAEPTPEPSPTETLIDFSYSASGAATLKTLTTGSLPLAGRIDAQLSLPSGTFTADLALAKTTGRLTALGFLPVNADVELISTEKVTGTLVKGKLTANAKVRIKLPSVRVFGLQLAGGAGCQAKQISAITLTSTQPTFLPLSGGPLAGTFAISDLTGCGFLTGLVSPLTQGSGNAIALNLAPAK